MCNQIQKDILGLRKNFLEKNLSKLEINSIDSQRAYFKFYMPLNVFKIWKILEEVSVEKKNLHVLDIGTGPMTAILGIYLKYGFIKSIYAIDRHEWIMKMGVNYIEDIIGMKMPVVMCKKNITNYDDLIKNIIFKPNLIILSYVLNELKDNISKKNIILNLINLLNDNGVLIIVDPATKEDSYQLEKIKNINIKKTKFELDKNVQNYLVASYNYYWFFKEFYYKRFNKNIKKIDKFLKVERNILKCSVLALENKINSNLLRKKFYIISGLMYNFGLFRRYIFTTFGKISFVQQELDFILKVVDYFRGSEIILDKNG